MSAAQHGSSPSTAAEQRIEEHSASSLAVKRICHDAVMGRIVKLAIGVTEIERV